MPCILPKWKAPMTATLNLNFNASDSLKAQLIKLDPGSKPEPAQIVEYGETSLILEVQSRMANAGHYLSVDVFSSDGVDSKPKLIFQGSGKVSKFEASPDGKSFRLELQLLQYDRGHWKNLCSRTSRKQKQINDLLLKNKF
jgi:hypothetical protein